MLHSRALLCPNSHVSAGSLDWSDHCWCNFPLRAVFCAVLRSFCFHAITVNFFGAASPVFMLFGSLARAALPQFSRLCVTSAGSLATTSFCALCAAISALRFALSHIAVRIALCALRVALSALHCARCAVRIALCASRFVMCARISA